MHIKKNKIKRRTACLLFMIIVLATGLRVSKLYIVDRYDKDGVLYTCMADKIAAGNIEGAIELRPEMPALFPYTIGQIKRYIGGNTEMIGVALNILFGVGVVMLSFSVVQLIFNNKIALLTALLSAINPVMVENSIGVMREQCALFFLLLSIYFCIKALKLDKLNIIIWSFCGISAGFAGLIRPDGGEMMPIIIIWALISFFFFKNERAGILKNILPGIIIFILMFFSTVVPVQRYFIKQGSYYTVFPNDKMMEIYLKID